MAATQINHLVVTNWKTTVAGILSTIVAASAAGFFAPNPFISTKVSGYCFAASGMARILLGILQTDGVSLPPGSTYKQDTTIQTPPAPPQTIDTTSKVVK